MRYGKERESMKERKREGEKMPKGKRSKGAMNAFAKMAKKRKRG